jgi:hypothetical protein
MKRLILLAALMGLAGAADAASNNSGCQGNCPSGDTINNTTNQGGAGVGVGMGVGVGVGQGGRGGDGGSVVGSGNSSNANTNANRNSNSNSNRQAQGQLQGQQQGQQQGQSQSSRNDNRSSAYNDGNNASQSVTVGGDTYEAARIPVATAYAPNIAPTAVCMGSSSIGGQGVTFGISMGTSWTDENCMLLEQVRTVAAVLGDKEVAAEMMCEVKAYAAARARAGKPCGVTKTAAAAPQQVVATREPTEAEKKARYTGSDPIVRARLGLPPLN